MAHKFKTVMIVDDDPVIREVLAALLKSRGYDVSVRSQALGTTMAILHEAPEVVIVDVDMPGLPGDGLLRALAKNTKVGFRMPVVIIHSSVGAERVDRIVKESNALGAIPKGDARAFLGSFEELLGKAKNIRSFPP